MSIKSKAILFRNLLYLNEVVKHSQINAAAEKNGIKASNLSKIIKDLEEIMQKQLFRRTPNGLIPTKEALNLFEAINNIETDFNKLSQQISDINNKKSLNLYVPENIELKNLHLFNESKISFSSIENADVIISYEEPRQNLHLITVENNLGNTFKQKIWISSKNTKQAIALAQFIICQMHL